jgi:hypothetical protein
MPYYRITNTHSDCNHRGCNEDEQFVESKEWVRLRAIFWTAFILVPLLTGFLAYRSLPNESYDEEHHTLLASHEVEAKENDYWIIQTLGEIKSRVRCTHMMISLSTGTRKP